MGKYLINILLKVGSRRDVSCLMKLLVLTKLSFHFVPGNESGYSPGKNTFIS